MIFVILGTQKFQFNRIIKSLDELHDLLKNEEVLIQSGYTTYKSIFYKQKDFFTNADFEKAINDANIIISHGGVGSLTSCLNKNKKVICVPREKQFNEHVDDHQKEISSKYSDLGYILEAHNTVELRHQINNINSFIPNCIKYDKGQIVETIISFIENEK